MSNQYETIARYRKAERIASAIEELEIFNADDIPSIPPAGLRLIEEFAQVRPASPATWALVGEVLRSKARARQLVPADPFSVLSK